jgi:hypothetical protein
MGFFEFLENKNKTATIKNFFEMDFIIWLLFSPFNCCLELERSPPTIKKRNRKDQKC